MIAGPIAVQMAAQSTHRHIHEPSANALRGPAAPPPARRPSRPASPPALAREPRLS